MPFTFPSHPGLILPLWIARPRSFDAVALALGSMLPDVIDLGVGFATGQYFGTKFAHSLLGWASACVPVGFVLVAALNPLCAALARVARRRRLAALASASRRMIARPFRWRRSLASVALGALSHLLFDALTHDPLDWFSPWATPSLIPRELSGPLLVLRPGWLERPVELWFVELSWLAWSVVGALLFAWCAWKARHRESWR